MKSTADSRSGTRRGCGLSFDHVREKARAPVFRKPSWYRTPSAAAALLELCGRRHGPSPTYQVAGKPASPAGPAERCPDVAGRRLGERRSSAWDRGNPPLRLLGRRPPLARTWPMYLIASNPLELTARDTEPVHSGLAVVLPLVRHAEPGRLQVHMSGRRAPASGRPARNWWRTRSPGSAATSTWSRQVPRPTSARLGERSSAGHWRTSSGRVNGCDKRERSPSWTGEGA